jgi:two-component system OmpR family sensor kinase
MTVPAQSAAMGTAVRVIRRPVGWVRRRWDGLTLRGRLITTVIVLLALICLIVGLVTGVVLRQYLVAQVDNRLTATMHLDADTGSPSQEQASQPGNEHRPGGALGPPDGSLSGTINSDGSSTVQYADPGGGSDGTSPVTAAQMAVLLTVPLDGRPTTRDLPGLGTFRLAAQSNPYGGRIVNGLTLGDVNSTLLRLAITELCVALAGMIGVGLIGETIISRTLRPLRRVAATASRVSEMKLDQGEVALSVRVPEADTDARTEVGQVGSSLNRMLGHVSTALTARQASETRARQFVADASHELRTPLAAIRGYAELTRRVGDNVPEDVRYAMGRVESESARMTGLVEDLLLLARLDEGRPLDHEPVDLTRLVIDAVSDAHVAGPSHKWTLELPDEPVSIAGDAARLHQVLANLLANARAHTPAGTTVTVTLSGGAGRGAVIRVADDGPGIPAELMPDVFERFARGDTSRSRAAGSTGLGLAIVSAVVDAHGGNVNVASEPGRTEFTVTIPQG